jgi:electron transfer flavoprotein beta subunit
MQIYVCVKHVPDTAANIRVVGGNAFDDSCKFVMNPYDEYGVGEVKQIEIGVLPVNYYKESKAIGA